MDINESPPRLRAASPAWASLRPRRGQPWLDWLKGAGFLVFHIDLFLVGIAALLLLNVARSPSHIWVGGVFWRWGLLLVIHGMAALLIWLIGLLLSEERPGAGTYEAEWSASSHDTSRPPVIVEPVEPEPESVTWTTAPERPNRPSPAANGWSAAEPAPATSDWQAGFEQRTSWSETTASAWLARHRSEPEPSEDGAETPDGPA